MKQLLNSKPVTLTLAAFGLGLLVWRLMVLIPSAALLEADAREGQPETSAPDDLGSFLNWTNRLRNSLELATWKISNQESDLRRDPFVFPPIPRGDSPTEEKESGPASKGGGALELQAISTSAGRTLVVINRQILAAGEMVEGFQVLSIEKDRVTVSGFGEQRVLTLGFELEPSPSSSDPNNPTATSPAPKN